MSRVRAQLTCSLVSVVALALAVPAHAAVRPTPGTYAGKAGGVAVSFRVTSARTLQKLRTGRLIARCADGRRVGVKLQATGSRWTVAARRGAYRSTVGVGNATRRGTLWVRARFTSRTRARGTIRNRFRYRATGIACDTGTRRFTVRLRRRTTTPWRFFGGKTADGSPLSIAMNMGGTAVRPKRMRATMQCTTGGTVTLDVVNPVGPDAPVTDGATFRGAWRYKPPAVPGRPAPSGGAVELSGRVTATGLEGAARLSIGFMDGTSCDGGWSLFSIAGNTAAG